MNEIIKQAVKNAFNGIYTQLQLDQRVKLEVGQHYDLFYVKVLYNNVSVHNYTIQDVTYDKYLYDVETDIDGLVDVVLLDLKKATKRG
jgi:hypothetical protein